MRTQFFLILLYLGRAVSVYFHEPSYLEIKPFENENFDFGFSLGYQKSGLLVVGAPHADLDGRVYICSMDDILKNETRCKKADIDIAKLNLDTTRAHNPYQHFNLGADIAAAEDYFLTCAPLWMSLLQDTHFNTTAYGTCYIYNGTAYRYQGIYEQHIVRPKRHPRAFNGGVGWKTLIDKVNDLILIAKPHNRITDLSYVSQQSPLSPANSIVQYSEKYRTRAFFHRYSGLAIATGVFSVSGVNETVYAYTASIEDLTSRVYFLRYDARSKKFSTVYRIINSRTRDFYIDHEIINSMFGVAMISEDLDNNGYSELLVGAPALGDGDYEYELGALYIFTGKELFTLNDPNNMRCIIGTKIGGRFGSAVASTDIDGDSFPEVIVSAPYEDSGVGAVYIISGLELNRMLLKDEVFKCVSLAQFKSTQRIQNKDFKSFGFSLQVIEDVNSNGCDELAIGSPESTRVIMFRGLPLVQWTLSTSLIGDQVVRIEEYHFAVRVNIEIFYPIKPEKVEGKFKLVNSIIGDGVQIDESQANKLFQISRQTSKYTMDVNVNITNHEKGSYQFTAMVEAVTDDIDKSKDFNPSWIVLDPNNLTSTMGIERRCPDESCLPQLNMTLEWTGSTPYTLGSSKSESVMMRIKNEGNSTYVQTCVSVSVRGAKVVQISCPKIDGLYLCKLPVPIQRNDEHTIELPLDMRSATNKDSQLVVDVIFYNNGCSLKSNYTIFDLKVPYLVDANDIIVNGSSHSLMVTDRDVRDTSSKFIKDEQEYTIENRGGVIWKDVIVRLIWQRYTFINNYDVAIAFTNKNCDKTDSETEVTITCSINLKPRVSIKFIATTEISTLEISKNPKGYNVSLLSNFSIQLKENMMKEWSLTTFIQYREVLTWTQDKRLVTLVAIIVALIVLAVVTFILYKIGFFKRETKEKLIVEKREHEFRRSMRNSAMTRRKDSAANESHQGESTNAGLSGIGNIDGSSTSKQI